MIRFALLCTTILIGCALPAFAGDAAFDAFFARFKAAVVKKDKAAVAAMTKLPYEIEYKKLDKTKFIARYEEVFPKSTISCFAKAKPVKDQDSYFVFCGESIYVFNKVNGKWLFTEIGVND